jgi:sterol desaturase/sphingolipid hydroxylase (fatty acid hydroxylase superfamily)
MSAKRRVASREVEPSEWRPSSPLTYSPVFQPSLWTKESLIKYFFSFGGFFFPWNIFWWILSYLTFTVWTPSLDRCGVFTLDWIGYIFIRNLALLWVIAGSWHLLLYQLKIDGNTKNKYNPEWQSTNDTRFLFNDQVYDNIFWSCTSGTIVWTLYEALFLYLWANHKIEYYENILDYPLWSLFLLIIVPYYREFHFYWVHRMIHWPPLYRTIHYLHHKNINPGPWSGISMHPIEHIFYFSCAFIHAIILSHPIHFYFNILHAALTPAGGHIGFHGPVVKESIPGGSYFHYLHHRYFECNYGESNVPLDRIFGSFHDGVQKPKLEKSILEVILVLSVGIGLSFGPLIGLLKN